MKVIIAGSRDITNINWVEEAVKCSGFPIKEIVSGGARGVDTMAEHFAIMNQYPCHIMEANWTRDGKAAGILRNLKMADYADALIAVWDGKSRGTKHMIETMEKLEKPVCIYYIPGTFTEEEKKNG